MSRFTTEITGAIETRNEMDRIARELHGSPMVDAMRDATLMVTYSARKLSPVNDGQLRASIVPEVRTEGREVIGIVGSNKVYAPAMEFGARPHWPPLWALVSWARKHGTTAYVVARAIARRGLAPRRYLRGALEQNAARIFQRLSDAVRHIVQR